MKDLLKTTNWLLGVQWLFFIFTNIVVIPITIGEAFQLSAEKTVMLLQLSFVLTGLACIIQAVFGHQRAIVEGQSGLWWGVILSLAYMAPAQGISLVELGGSLSVGIIITGMLSVLIGVTGMGAMISKWFNANVMGVFMFLLAVQLVSNFLKGMLGIPFSHQTEPVQIDVPVTLLSIFIALLVIFINIRASFHVRKYSLLIGIVVGWLLYAFFFKQDAFIGEMSSFSMELFPLGPPAWNIGIIVTTVIAGLLNTANTFGALKGTDSMYKRETTKAHYRSSFTITGMTNVASGLFGLVPTAPYVSSIGFLGQMGVTRRLPFILGSFMFIVMGIIPAIGRFFSTLPLSVGSAVLFVAYLQLFLSSWNFFNEMTFNSYTVYRTALPLFVGIIIMTMPAAYFSSIPPIIRPLVSNGMLVGITLALIMESVFPWDRFTASKKSA
ncbi:MAG TPA: uracil/xanthine transporter [Bacillota bacterium]